MATVREIDGREVLPQKSDRIMSLESEIQGILQTLDNVGSERRLEKLFGEWNLKDILAHLTGWARHDIACIKSLTDKNKVPYWDDSLDRMNQTFVKKRANQPWGRVRQEFIDTSNELLETYIKLPISLWQEKVWNDRDLTPVKFVDDDIEHYKAHRKEIEDLITK